MLAIVAPVTMSSDQQEVWLRAAVDALEGIHPTEVADVSLEVRRSVTRPSQIVPEIARLVAEHRAEKSRLHRIRAENEAISSLPPPKRPVMDRRGEPMSEEETAELNGILEKLRATARYRTDGSKYFVERVQ